ncbi:substrate-binding domain-containing protein, partial [Anabaena sp. CS-542/02]|uniref:substrate-binding domain-containing protein n=1 Tax=Anabaena sp. CS-542/02 TaxID=3021719 RepID=UPI00232D3543
MWQEEKKDSAIVTLALLLSLVTTPMTVPLFVPTPVLAQSATDSFLAPQTVEDQTTLKIDGSTSLGAINRSLKQSFEQGFSGTNVEVATNGSDAAISALLSANIDIAAIPRDLTPEEQAQGLAQVLIHSAKIAIIVSTDNPFEGSLTSEQFAGIFSGNITNWSEVGGTDSNIRFIDRPVNSETRNTFRTYPGFQGSELVTGANATVVLEDDITEIIAKLGNDGISYAMLHDVSRLPNVRVIPVNETLPDQLNYIYSLPLVYAYRQNPSPNLDAFIKFTQAVPGKQAIETALVGGEVETLEIPGLDPPAPLLDEDQSPENISSPDQMPEIPLWWLLLPTSVIIGLLIWLFRSRRADPKKKVPGYTGEISKKNEDSTSRNDTSVTAATATGSVVAPETVNDQELVETQNFKATDSQVSLVFEGENLQSKYSLDQTAAQHQPEFDLSASLRLSENISARVTNLQEISLDMSEEVLNAVADAAEPINHRTVCDHPEKTDIFADSQTFVEMGIDHEGHGGEDPLLNHPLGDSLADVAMAAALNGERSIILKLRNAEWAYVTWYIDQTCQEALSNNGISQLYLRLYDVTDLNLSYQSPQLLQEYEVKWEIPEKYIPIPQTDLLAGGLVDRNYIAAIGFKVDDNWVTITSSERVRVFATPQEDTRGGFHLDGDRSMMLKLRNPEWAYATWYIDQTCQEALSNNGISQLYLRLYDVTDLDLSYQSPQVLQEY